MMKLMFILAAVTIPLFVYFDKGATGFLLSFLFLFLGAFFSKPRFNIKDK
ncbi:hypothetical protein [Aquibacillus rhizosphaerae]|uniref:Uncharacterized protein n=1 Tax=Aquibacillus rhizosphaerae TaxID=3051431 RepID=A0ABT7L0W7_9BACI|nr:hypothetical protein [Aquibacillus sp. LR5S19]MDL4839476.1 hypothetical protein [Aquibacillus sp. LR5S19]